MFNPRVNYLWATLLTGIILQTYAFGETKNLNKTNNFSKTFVRKFDSPIPISKRNNSRGVHILEAGSRFSPPSPTPSTESLESTTTVSYANGHDHDPYTYTYTYTEDEDILQPQESFGNLATVLISGTKKLFQPKKSKSRPRPTFNKMVAYRPNTINRSRPRPRPNSHPHPTPPSSSLLLLPTVTDKPKPPSVPKPTVPEFIETDLPEIDPGIDFETTTGSQMLFPTIVPILGGRERERDGLDDDGHFPIVRTNSRSRFGSGRSLFSSSTTRAPPVVGSLPRRRIIGSGAFGNRLKPKQKSTPPSLIDIDIESENVKELKLNDLDVITDFAFSDIKCFRTKSKEYFGAVVHMKNGYHLPYIRDRPQDPMSSNECLMERTDSPNAYHMKISDLRSCGVEQCSSDADHSMCLTMVFPRVPMLAMADDEVTTIKCAPQKSTMSETRSVSFTGDISEARRSSSTVEGGGQEYVVEVGVFRQTPGTKNGLFVKRVSSGGVVQLGESLQLRSVVRGGDGWTFSKLTDVKVWRMRDSYDHRVDTLNPNDASEVITLVDPRGCRNDDYKIISPAHPLRDPRNDLVHHFNFKAFLFRGQRANEPLIVTAKVQACQDREDCDLIDCTRDSISDPIRYKRSALNDKNSSGISQDWSSQFALRVIGLKDHPVPVSSISDHDHFIPDDDDAPNYYSTSTFSCTDKVVGSAIFSGFFVLFLSSLIFVLATLCHQKISSTRTRNGTGIPKNSVQIPKPNSILKKSPSFQTDFIRSVVRASKGHGETKLGPNKPLPPIPCTDLTTTVSKIGRSSVKTRNVSKILQNVRSDNNFLGENSDSEGIYVVYCCNDKNRKRSTSAPPSLRDKKKKLAKAKDARAADDTEDSQSDSACENFHHRRSSRTRSAKQVNRAKKYSDHNHECAGSFPSRINKKILPGNRSCRDFKRQRVNSVNYSNGSSRVQLGGRFSEDSAYSGSISSLMPLHGNPVIGNASASTSSSKFTKQENNRNDNNKKSVTTHFVTRNDLSTQIIIIPDETSL